MVVVTLTRECFQLIQSQTRTKSLLPGRGQKLLSGTSTPGDNLSLFLIKVQCQRVRLVHVHELEKE